MTKYDEYRHFADDAQRHADNAVGDEKVRWLTLVQSWLGLLPKPELTAEQSFDAESKTKRTSQDDSETSH